MTQTVTTEQTNSTLLNFRSVGKFLCEQGKCVAKGVIGGLLVLSFISTPPSALNTIYNYFSAPEQNSIVIHEPAVETLTKGFHGTMFRLSNPKAEFVMTQGDEPLGMINETIKNRVESKGTLDVLNIFGHGSKWSVSMSNSKSYDLDELLQSFKKTQDDLGIPIAKRIVFTSCNVAKDLNQKQINEICGFAKELGSQIAVSTSYVGGSVFETGKYYAFNTDGSITKDQKYTNSLVTAAIDFSIVQMNPYSVSWVDYHQKGKLDKLDEAYDKASDKELIDLHNRNVNTRKYTHFLQKSAWHKGPPQA